MSLNIHITCEVSASGNSVLQLQSYAWHLKDIDEAKSLKSVAHGINAKVLPSNNQIPVKYY